MKDGKRPAHREAKLVQAFGPFVSPAPKKGKAVGPGRERAPRARREANLVRAFGPFVPGPEKGKASGPGEARGRNEE